jgi:putative oxidoreductase
LIVRLVVGLTVAAHGSQKLFGWFQGAGISGFAKALERLGLRPAWAWAWVSALAEGVRGILVAVGLLTPIVALIVAANMLVAIITAHVAKGFWNKDGGYEFPLVLMAGAVAVSLTGAGNISLDRVFHVALPEPVTWIVVAIVVLIGALTPALVLPRIQARTAQAEHT